MNQAHLIINELIEQGIHHFCIAPGSRSAPLALAAATHPKTKITVHFDERGLGFYALGIAKGSKIPVALITTSGSAVANLYPAVMEAFHSRVPLILLTADRPHELRACGANQSTDQVKLFSNVIRAQTDLSPHIGEKSIRSIIAQNVFQSLQNPPGPVHLNCPFQEPLFTPAIFHTSSRPISFSLPQLVANPIHTEAKKGIILLGAVSDPIPVLKLAQKLKWPVFADLLSQARKTPTPEQIRHFDYLIRSDIPLKPDFILHFGDRFISKNILNWSKQAPTTHVSPIPFLQDPERTVASRVQSDIKPFCDTFEAKTDPSWLSSWQQIDQEIHTLLEEQFKSYPTESHAIHSLPSNRPIFFGNSMPIRDADHFYFPIKAPQIFANRGVSGIDGNIATIAGIAEALQTPLLAFIGDQTALHDINSLPLIKKHKILLIISNNFGGGIFDHLPVSKSPYCETLFTAAHAWNFESAAKMFDIPYVRIENSLENLPQDGIVEFITERKANYRFQESCIQQCKTLLDARIATYGLSV